MYPGKILLAALAISLSPMTFAMSLGEGQILNHVGEIFTANIALNGSYSDDVSFAQAGNAECRSAFLASVTDSCTSLYSGQLTVLIKQRPDGRYFLSVTGEKGNELFYRILIKSTSATAGTSFKIYEFLPEFILNQEESPVTASMTTGQNISNTNEAMPKVNGRVASPALFNVPVSRHEVIKHKQLDVILHKQSDTIKKNPAVISLDKPVQTRLEIKKNAEYADDIQALSKENGEIEAQIELLQKHIGLLKEVIRLKSEAGVMPNSAALPSRTIPLQIQTDQSEKPGLLTWVLLAVVFVFALLLVWMSQKIKGLSLMRDSIAPATGVAAPEKEEKSLDLTGTFTKAKW